MSCSDLTGVEEFYLGALGIRSEDWTDLEPSTEVVSFLQDVATMCKQRTTQNLLQRADAAFQAKEYAVQCRRVREITDAAKLHLTSLSSSGRANVQSVAAVSSHLQLSNTKETAFMAAWTNLCLTELEATACKGAVDCNSQLLEHSLERVQAGLSHLEGIATSLQQKHCEDEKKLQADLTQIELLKQKAEEYQRNLAQSKRKCKHLDAQPELQHTKLVERAREHTILQNQLDGLRARLNNFHQLPPSMLAAQMILEKAQKELFDIQTRFDQSLANL